MAQVSFRIDDNIKAKAESACAAMGMTMSAAINIFLTKVANERRITFVVFVYLYDSDEHIDILERRNEDIKAGRNMHEHDLSEVE